MTESVLLVGLTGEPPSLLITGGRITAVGAAAEEMAPPSPRSVRCDGLRAVCGFIELQVNGIDDRDFTTDPAAMWEVGERLARHGVTAFLPTVVTSPRGTVERALEAFASRPAEPVGARPIGLHVEGPFISPARRGAHADDLLRPPDLDEIDAWVAAGARVITLAPELPRAIEAIERIVAGGGIAAVGHTDADAATVDRAVAAGARYATHLFNAMPPLHHRAPGAVAALLGDERVTLGLIADGVHVDPRMLSLVARLAPGRVSLVSDQVARRLGDAELAVDDGSPRLSNGTLAGSLDPLDHGVRVFAAAIGSVDAALAAVTGVPARLLGLADGGALAVGARADIVLLDHDLHVAATLVAGRVAFAGDRISWT